MQVIANARMNRADWLREIRAVVFVLVYLTAIAFRLAAQTPTPGAKEIEKIRAEAEAGDAKSQYQLAIHILKFNPRDQFDEPTEQTRTEACKWWRKAAEQNFAPAQRELGTRYSNGGGVPLDAAEACKWWRKAAEQNDALAQFYLGSYLEDKVEAAKWYRKAAEQNLDQAQASLGRCYFFGHGVPEDDVQAYKWLALARAHGTDLINYVSKEELNRAESKLTPAQKAEAEKLVREFKPSAPSGSPTP